MKSKVIFLISFLVIISIIIIILSSTFFTTDSQNKAEEEKSFIKVVEEKIKDILGIGNSNSDQTTTPRAGNSGAGNGGRGGGSSSGESSSSEPSCPTKEISYSMINFNKNSTCNQYQGEICVDKTVICSTEIHNRDQEISGSFEIEFMFLEDRGDVQNPIYLTTSKFSLEPQSFEFVEKNTDIQSSGQDGLANQIINCFLKTLEVPTKCV